MRPEIVEVLTSENLAEDYVLSSIYEIENLLLLIQQAQKRVEHLKGLKKYRSKSIDDEMLNLNEQMERLRGVVQNTMTRLSPQEKTIPFPGIGKVSRRQVKASWKIDDEEAMLAFFEQEGVKDQVVKMKEIVDAREAKKLLDNFQDLNTQVPGASQTPGGEAITITFEKDEDKPMPRKTAPNAINLDELEL